MNRTEYHFLQAEKNSLVHLLETAPKEAVIERIGFEARLRKVETNLKQFTAQQLPVQGQITFRGKPVLGSQGIESVFASQIMDKFSSVIAAKASSYSGTLSKSGKIPNRDDYRLNITGTSVGSFGFVFEESISDLSNQQMFNGTLSPVERAIIDSIAFFEALRKNDAEELADAIDNTDERVLDEFRRFLSELASNEATCAVESSTHSFRFADVSEVQQFSKQIDVDNIREWEEDYIGEFIGVLPFERKFNFQPKNENEPLIKGKISQDIVDLENINRHHLFQQIKIHVFVKQIGSGSQRYTLSGFSVLE